MVVADRSVFVQQTGVQEPTRRLGDVGCGQAGPLGQLVEGEVATATLSSRRLVDSSEADVTVPPVARNSPRGPSRGPPRVQTSVPSADGSSTGSTASVT